VNFINMTHGSLFSGIGGFDLAAEWMGWENKFHCEWNEFGQKVLHYYWPKAELFTDITKSDFTKYNGTIDIISGGFPCQPYSSAGKRLGKEDSRHLWPEMLRAIREIRPRWVVGENVRGLTNWNGGLVFDEVQSDLEAEGYEVTPFLLPACAVNAPHRRDRIWFVAYSTRTSKRTNEFRNLRCENGEVSGERTQTIYNAIRPNGSERDASHPNRNGLNERNSNNEVNTSEGRFDALSNINESNGNGNVADTNSWRTQSEQNLRQKVSGKKRIDSNGTQSDASNTTNIGRTNALENGQMERGRFRQSNQRNTWDTFPSVTPICTGDDGISDRLDGITFPKWRNESIKAAGNAIVPQVVLQIFKAIEQYENFNNNGSGNRYPDIL
jgi:DNA (cytosine-5)-methyltransferase 1